MGFGGEGEKGTGKGGYGKGYYGGLVGERGGGFGSGLNVQVTGLSILGWESTSTATSLWLMILCNYVFLYDLSALGLGS